MCGLQIVEIGVEYKITLPLKLVKKTLRHIPPSVVVEILPAFVLPVFWSDIFVRHTELMIGECKVYKPAKFP